MQNMIVYDYLFVPAGPRSTAAAVSAENMPQAYFPNASTVLKEIIALSIYLVFISLAQNAGLFFCFECVCDYLFVPAGPRRETVHINKIKAPYITGLFVC